MFERFTDRARTVVQGAQSEARRLTHNYIGTEHILLGLVAEGGGVAAIVLHDFGIELGSLRDQVEEIIGKGATPPPEHIPFTPRAKKVLELSLREALQLGHNYIGTEHILLGLIREADGVAAQILVARGVDLAQARAQVINRLTTYTAQAVGAESVDVPGRRRRRRSLAKLDWLRLSDRELQILELFADGRSQREIADTFSISENAVKNLLRMVALKHRGVAGSAEPKADGGPTCPSCETVLRESARYELLEVAPREGDATAQVLFLYCSSCGEMLDDLILPEER